MADGFSGTSSTFTPDNKYVLTVNGRLVCLWETESGTRFANLTNSTEIASVDISPTGGQFISQIKRE